MERQVDKTIVDVKGIAELDEEQMKGRDNANNRRLRHRHVEGSVVKNGISEAVATEGGCLIATWTVIVRGSLLIQRWRWSREEKGERGAPIFATGTTCGV